jgi:mannose-6-phosphate isomerase-like protein (cupin superfamily)
MLLQNPDGTQTTSEVLAGNAYSRDAGVSHNVINQSEQKMSFIEVELKNSSVITKT